MNKTYTIYMSFLPYMQPQLIGFYGSMYAAEIWKVHQEQTYNAGTALGYVYEIREE
jgi:hypothetical protein